MRKLNHSILILLIILFGCKTSTKDASELNEPTFTLKNDYSNFQKLMSERDTIMFWMDLSVCLHQGMEKSVVTKKGDSLKIIIYYKESAFSDKEYTERKTIKISVNDTTWSFGEFLAENKNRTRQNEKGDPTFGMYSDTAKLYFYTYGLADLNRFIIDYSKVMRRLDPENPVYRIADLEDVEIEEGIELLNDIKD